MTHSGKNDKSEPQDADTGDQPISAGDEYYLLRLYIAGHSARSAAALANLQEVCEKNLVGRYRIEVINLLEQPELAKRDQIVAIPTLVRSLPQPLKRLIGNLANTERVLVGLEVDTEEQ
jgi:circadian clock protein KaiB